MAVIDRTAFNALVDDSGGGINGSIVDKALIAAVLLDPMDAALATAGSVDVGVCEGRLTLTTLVPVTTADVTGATSIKWTPYKGKYVALYNGTSAWVLRAFAETSLALGTLTSGLPYDVFAYDNAGTLALELLAWTNGTTRATALVLQDGVLSKTGALTRRYLGTFYTTSTTTTEDSAAKRFVWNYYNRVRRALLRQEPAASWTYTTATNRQANNNTANKVEAVVGWAEAPVTLACGVSIQQTNAGINAAIGIGEDSVTTFSPSSIGAFNEPALSNIIQASALLTKVPTVGYHYWAWLEYSQAVGTTTWWTGNSVVTGCASGLSGSIEG